MDYEDVLEQFIEVEDNLNSITKRFFEVIPKLEKLEKENSLSRDLVLQVINYVYTGGDVPL